MTKFIPSLVRTRNSSLPCLIFTYKQRTCFRILLVTKTDFVFKALCTISTSERRVSDPHHFSADPDQDFYFNADPDPALHFNSDPDPTLHEGDANLRPLTYRLSWPPFFLSLHVSILSVHGHPGSFLSLESSWILTFMRIRIRLFTLMPIRIQLLQTMRIRSPL